MVQKRFTERGDRTSAPREGEEEGNLTACQWRYKSTQIHFVSQGLTTIMTIIIQACM